MRGGGYVGLSFEKSHPGLFIEKGVLRDSMAVARGDDNGAGVEEAVRCRVEASLLSCLSLSLVPLLGLLPVDQKHWIPGARQSGPAGGFWHLCFLLAHSPRTSSPPRRHPQATLTSAVLAFLVSLSVVGRIVFLTTYNFLEKTVPIFVSLSPAVPNSMLYLERYF